MTQDISDNREAQSGLLATNPMVSSAVCFECNRERV